MPGGVLAKNKIFLPSCPPPRLETEPTRTQERWDCPSPPLALTAQDSVPRLRRHIAGDTAQGWGCDDFLCLLRECSTGMGRRSNVRPILLTSADDPSSIEWPPVQNRQVDRRIYFLHLSGLNFALDASYGFRTRVFSGRRPVRWSFFVTGVLLLRWRPRKTQHLERWARPLRRRAAC